MADPSRPAVGSRPHCATATPANTTSKPADLRSTRKEDKTLQDWVIEITASLKYLPFEERLAAWTLILDSNIAERVRMMEKQGSACSELDRIVLGQVLNMKIDVDIANATRIYEENKNVHNVYRKPSLDLPPKKRWDQDWKERHHFERLYVNRGSIKQKLRKQLDATKLKRREWDNEGLPNYIMTIYGDDWTTVKELALVAYPGDCIEGEYNVDEVKAWLQMVRACDGFAQRTLYIENGYIKHYEEKIGRDVFIHQKLPRKAVASRRKKYVPTSLIIAERASPESPGSIQTQAQGLSPPEMEGDIDGDLYAAEGKGKGKSKGKEAEIPDDDDPFWDTEDDSEHPAKLKLMRRAKNKGKEIAPILK